jgi:hypothetical protein
VVESSRSGNLFKLGLCAMGENSTRLGNPRAGPALSRVRTGRVSYLYPSSNHLGLDDKVTAWNSSLPMSSPCQQDSHHQHLRTSLHSSTLSARVESTKATLLARSSRSRISPLTRTDSREKASRIQSQSFDKTSLSSV